MTLPKPILPEHLVKFMSAIETELINCPQCQYANFKHLFRKEGWNIVRCVSCSLAMVNPGRKDCYKIYESDEYYNNEKYYYDYEGNKAAYQKGFRSKLKLIEKYVDSSKKLLDVGAAYGFFMEEAQRQGFHTSGVELSSAAAKCASHYGKVYQQPFEDIVTQHRFSVVSFIDSLEHFQNPVTGLQKAWELLEPNGIVAVMVPNIDSFFARLAKARWHLLLPEEHLFYFNPASIQSMLNKTGFEVLYMGTGGYGRSMDEIFRVLFRGKGILPDKIQRLLRKINFEINLGDLFVLARKSL